MLKRKEQTKPKEIVKKIIHIRAEISVREKRKIIEKINKTKVDSLKMSTKLINI